MNNRKLDELSYIRLDDLSYPHGWQDICRAVYPASLSLDSSLQDLADIGFAPVEPIEMPGIKPYDEVREGNPEFIEGAWRQKWVVSRRPLQECKAIILSELNRTCDSLLAQIKSAYPQSEVEGWAKQEAEARSLLGGQSTDTPMLSAIAAARGISVMDLASRVMTKSAAYAAIYGEIVGTRQALETDLEDADEETIDLIVWPGN